MFTPFLNNYGCGWEIRELPAKSGQPAKKVRTHEGFLFCWHTRFYQIPDDQYLIVILSNGGSAPIENMTAGITDILYGRPVENRRPLVANEIWKSHADNSVTQTIDRFRTQFKNDPADWDFSEYDLNRLGYTLLLTDQPPAIEVFRFITEIYPQSWNAWDSLGEGLATAGKKEEAIKAYQKSVELNPENKAGIEMLKRLESE
jgi:tetratricopeptide (TPR) repeat protein